MAIKIVAISDTHSDHLRLKNLPDEADMIIHSGDCTHEGKFQEYINFIDWYAALPYKYKILTPGNHDFVCEQMPSWAKDYAVEKGIDYLCDSGIEIDGFKIWGSPWTPYCGNWAFSPRDPVDLIVAFNKIPTDVNILVTHGPAKGHLDGKYGSEHLRSVLSHLPDLKLHVFGHIHEAYGMAKQVVSGPGICRGIVSQPFFVNAAMAGCKQHAYKNCASNHKPHVLVLQKPGEETEVRSV